MEPDIQNDSQSTPARPKRFFVVLASCLLLLAAFSLFLAYEIYLPHTNFRGEKQIEIPQGYGSRLIGGLLRDQGFIQSKWAFVTLATFKNKASSLKPGLYVFSENSTMPQILDGLTKGEKYPNERFLTIPEGWSLRDIGFYLERSGIAQAEELWEVAGFPAADYNTARDLPRPKDFSGEFSFLKDKPANVGLEGYLFPDTYRVYRDASMEEIIKKMLANFERRVSPDIRQEILRQKKSLFDILTIASLIEEEVTGDEDRVIVSGILWKRLELGIPLQVDATLIYIKGNDGTSLTNQDKMVASPYNTYRYKGLPRGPIANPGISTIRAAVYPKTSPYLYYLSSKNGETIFSKTLEEHNRAKADHLR